jgi:hypothetical protein
VPLGDEQRDPHQGVASDLVELVGRVAIAEVPSPAAEEDVDLRDNLLDRRGEPSAHRQEPDAVSGVLRRLT